MPLIINETECRVLGCLVEKELTTPEYYPLTLNALVAACNQKSNRDPVMSLGETEVVVAIDSLREKNLVYTFHGSTSRTVKYKHVMPSVLELEPPAVAVMTLLLLRGAQTAGEIRGRSERLYEFGSVAEVQEVLDELAARSEPLVRRLERQSGQKEARYAHVLSGEVTEFRGAEPQVGSTDPLMEEVSRLREELDTLRVEFDEFRKQFT